MSLPLAAYVDEQLLRIEERRLHEAELAYAGHERWVPAPGDFRAVPFDESLVLLNHSGRPTLLDNVCAHRQAILLEGSGQLGRVLTCPFHSWSYRLDGSLLNAPGMLGAAGMDGGSCEGLRRHELSSWQGLQFRGAGTAGGALDDIDEWPLLNRFSFDGYKLHAISTERYAFDWKIFIEVYLDLYHVRPFHPGLGRFVSCDKLEWAFGRNWSCQIAPFGSLTGGTPVFQRWCDEIARRPGPLPTFGALWLTLYPNTTVEVYPETLIVSTIWPDGPGRSLNVVEYYYPETLGDDLERYAAVQQAAYDETAVEDGELCLRIQRGKEALVRRGVEALSPDHPHLEAGIGHFHDWLATNLGAQPVS